MLSKPAVKTWQRISSISAVLALLIGLLGLTGWITGSQLLKRGLLDGATMKVNTALIIMVSSAILIALRNNLSWLVKLLVFVLLAAIGLILAEHLFHADFKIDNLIFTDNNTNPLVEQPGRTSFLTAVCALILAISMLLLHLKRYTMAQILATVSFALLYASLLTSLFNLSGLFKAKPYSGIAFNTVIALLLLSLATLLYKPREGWMVIINGKVFCRKITAYTLTYFFCAVPVVVASHLIIVGDKTFSKSTSVLLLQIITTLTCVPIAYLLLSRLKRLAKNLRKANEQYTIAIRAAGMGVWDMNILSGVITQSEKQAELLGQPFKETIADRLFFDQIYIQDREMVEQAFAAAQTNGTLEVQCRILLPDLRERWIQLFGETRYDEDSKPVRMLGTINDISLRKELERHKDEFISTVSHELKTPITSIKAQTQLLERKFTTSADAVTAMMLQRINLQINKLNTIIKDLLEAGQIEDQKLVIRKEQYFFKEMVEETVAEIQRTTTTHQLLIENNQEIVCIGDKGRTCQVLSNLLINAIKYSPGKDKVVVSVHEQENEVRCSVQDYGIGIAPEKQGRIFDRFYRAATDNNHVISGFGLGLYICSQIIKRLNGKIGILRTSSEGSVFYFSVPKTI